MSLEKAVIARITISNQTFEILVDSKLALSFRNGKDVRIEDILAYPAIYKNAKRGELASMQDLKRAFGTTDTYKIAERIVRNGEVQITAEQRKEMMEQKKYQIASLISKRCINPQTNSPHPLQRIINAMEEAGISIDPFLDAESQFKRVLERLKSYLPLKIQNLIIRFKIPANFASKSYSLLKSFGNVKNEVWQNDGSLKIDLEVPAGLQEDLFEKVAKLCKGNFESEIIERIE